MEPITDNDMIWEGKDGTCTQVNKMTQNHLENTYAMLNRTAAKQKLLKGHAQMGILLMRDYMLKELQDRERAHFERRSHVLRS